MYLFLNHLEINKEMNIFFIGQSPCNVLQSSMYYKAQRITKLNVLQSSAYNKAQFYCGGLYVHMALWLLQRYVLIQSGPLAA